ncbi:MAG: GIY-YIG nuclease family protein [Fusobacteriaceae bacterium]
MWCVYILRCKDNSLYTGITTNLEKRFAEHVAGTGAKYTRARKAIKIEIFWNAKDKSEASIAEFLLKQQKKIHKERFILDRKLFLKFAKEQKNIDLL